MATKATERLETDAVSQSRSERVERLSRTRTSSGTRTKEYRAIKRHSATIIEILGSTVGDPARFARRLRVESLVTDGIVQAASVVGILTISQRIAPIVEAVLAQIQLKANLFHVFMDVLRRENSCLGDIIQQQYSSSLELNAVEVVAGMSDWEELGHQLGTSPAKISQLEENGGDTEHCREEVVLEWLKEDKTASWEKLCRALEQMGREAEVQIIKEQYFHVSDHSLESQSSKDCGRPDTRDVHVQVTITDQVQEFEARFDKLILRLEKELLKNEASMCELRHSVIRLPISIKTEHYQFVKECSEDIGKAGSIEDLFRHLNMYWTYLEYSLLNRIIDSHSSILSIELRDEMNKYKKEIETFKQCTTIKQLLQVGLGVIRREPPPHFFRIVTKLKQRPAEYTLEKLDQFRHEMCFEFNLPTFILMLESFKEGSLCIKWHIPSSEVHHFTLIFATLKCITEDWFGFIVDFSTEHDDHATSPYGPLLVSSSSVPLDKPVVQLSFTSPRLKTEPHSLPATDHATYPYGPLLVSSSFVPLDKPEVQLSFTSTRLKTEPHSFPATVERPLCTGMKDLSHKKKYCVIPIRPIRTQLCSWTISFCVTFLLPTYIKAVKQQCEKTQYIALQPKLFNFGSTESPALVINLDKYPNGFYGGWTLHVLSNKMVFASDIDHSDIDSEEMQLRHEQLMYPPRFTVEVACNNAEIGATGLVWFSGADKELRFEFPMEPHGATIERPVNLAIVEYNPLGERRRAITHYRTGMHIHLPNPSYREGDKTSPEAMQRLLGLDPYPSSSSLSECELYSSSTASLGYGSVSSGHSSSTASSGYGSSGPVSSGRSSSTASSGRISGMISQLQIPLYASSPFVTPAIVTALCHSDPSIVYQPSLPQSPMSIPSLRHSDPSIVHQPSLPQSPMSMPRKRYMVNTPPDELMDIELTIVSRDILAKLAEDSCVILQSYLGIPDHLMVSEVKAQETPMGRVMKMLKIWRNEYCGEWSMRDALAGCLRRSDPRLASTAEKLSQYLFHSISQV